MIIFYSFYAFFFELCIFQFRDGCLEFFVVD